MTFPRFQNYSRTMNAGANLNTNMEYLCARRTNDNKISKLINNVYIFIITSHFFSNVYLYNSDEMNTFYKTYVLT